MVASRASVVIDPFALFIDRTLVPVRLVFDGVEITVQRAADGSFSVVGAPQGATAGADGRLNLPEEVSVLIRDSEVVYVDESLGIRWPFTDVRADIEQEFRAISVSITAEPPAPLGDRISITADGITTAAAQLSDDWRAFVMLRNANLAAIAEVLPQAGVESGSGDISVWLQSDDGAIVSALADIALENVVVPFEDQQLDYERIALIGEFTHQDDSWSAVFSDVDVTGPNGAWPRSTTTSLHWDAQSQSLEVLSDFILIEDLVPFIAALPESDLRDGVLARRPQGQLEAVTIRVRNTEQRDYEVSGRFSRLGVSDWNGFEALSGLSGELRADSGGGALEISSARANRRAG